MVKTCKVKVDEKTYTVDYDTDEYEKLIYEVSVSAKEGRNAFKCIHCKAKFTSKQRLNYHRLKGCDRALDINGKPLELRLYPSVISGGAVEVRDILEKNNLHVRNTFKCIHCNKECLSKQRLNYHCRMCCPGVLDINSQPLQLKLLPSVPSGGAAEFRNISEKHNFHRVCEPEESDLLASFGEDVLHGSPLQLPCKDGSELPDAASVTPIVYKEHPESHEVSAEFRDISEKHNFHWVCEPEESVSAKKGRNCIPKFTSKQLLNYHPLKGFVPLVTSMANPSAPSGGAAEVSNILDKHHFHGVCEPEESDLLASFGEDKMMGCRMCTMADAT